MLRTPSPLRRIIARMLVAGALFGALALMVAAGTPSAHAAPAYVYPGAPQPCSPASLSVSFPAVNIYGKCFTPGGQVYVESVGQYSGQVYTSTIVTADSPRYVCSIIVACHWVLGGNITVATSLMCGDESVVTAYDYTRAVWVGPIYGFNDC